MRFLCLALSLFCFSPPLASAQIPQETKEIASSLSQRRNLFFLHLRKIDALVNFFFEQIEKDPSFLLSFKPDPKTRSLQFQTSFKNDPKARQESLQFLSAIKMLINNLGIDLSKGLVFSLESSPFLLEKIPVAPSLWFWLQSPGSLEKLLGMMPPALQPLLRREKIAPDQEAFLFLPPGSRSGPSLFAFRHGLRLFLTLLPELTPPSPSRSRSRNWLASSLFASSFHRFALFHPTSSLPPSLSLASSPALFSHSQEIADPSALVVVNLQAIARLALGLLPPKAIPPPFRPLLRKFVFSTLGQASFAFDLFPQTSRSVASAVLSFGPSGNPFAPLFLPSPAHQDPSSSLPASSFALSQTTFRFDLLLPFLRSLASSFPLLATFVAQEAFFKIRFQREFGLDLENDLLSLLSGQIVTSFFSQPSQQAHLSESLQGMAILLGLKEPSSFLASFKKLLDALVLKKILPRYQTSVLGSSPALSLSLPGSPLPLHFVFHNRWLLLAPDLPTLQTLVSLPSDASLASKLFPRSPERLALQQGRSVFWSDFSSLSTPSTDAWKPSSIEEEVLKRSLLRIQRVFYHNRVLPHVIASFIDGQNKPFSPPSPLPTLPPSFKDALPHALTFAVASPQNFAFTVPYAAFTLFPLLADPLLLSVLAPAFAIPAFVAYRKAARNARVLERSLRVPPPTPPSPPPSAP